MDKRIKPEMWDISPALSSDPEKHRGAWAIYPLWENAPDFFDASLEKNDPTTHNIIASMLVETDYGVAVLSDTGGVRETITLPSTPFGGNDPCSFHFFGIQDGDVSAREGWVFAESTEIVLRIKQDGSVEFILNSFSTNDRIATATGLIVAGDVFYITGSYDGTTLVAFATVNGKTFSASIVPTGTYTNTGSAMLVMDGGLASRQFVGKTLYFEVSARACTLDEHIQRALDPFSLIRPANDFYIPAVFGDLGAPPAATNRLLLLNPPGLDGGFGGL